MRRLIVLMFVLATFAPSLAAAQKHPGAEMLNGFHADVVSAAQEAEKVAVKADKTFAETVTKLKEAETALRKAIAEETDASAFGVVYSRCVFLSSELLRIASEMVFANTGVVVAHALHAREPGNDMRTFMRWYDQSVAHEDVLLSVTADKKLLADAKEKARKLGGK